MRKPTIRRLRIGDPPDSFASSELSKVAEIRHFVEENCIDLKSCGFLLDTLCPGGVTNCTNHNLPSDVQASLRMRLGGPYASPSLCSGVCSQRFSVFSFSAISSAAQVDRGAIVGTVTDPTGARISDAQLTITNLETGQPVHLTTDDQGNYSAKLLRIGTYSVAATKQGFETTVQTGVDVAVNQSARVDLVLKLGATSERVEVTGAAPLLQTESSSLGTIETERRISDLPLNGRNFIQLAYLGPGSQWRPDRIQREWRRV